MSIVRHGARLGQVLASSRAVALAAALLSIVGCRPRSDADLPGAPSAVVATAGVRSAHVTWAAPAADGGAAIERYDVTGSPGNVTVSTSKREVEITGLANGTTYTFEVTATSSAGTGPTSSPSAPVMTPAMPGAPTGVSVRPDNGAIEVSWDAADPNGSPVIHYAVTAEPGGITTTASATSARLEPLVNGTSYSVTVTAWNAVGAGPGSSPATATPRTVPGAPQSLVATPGDGSAHLSWEAPSNDGGAAVERYVVMVIPDGDVPYALDAVETSIDVVGLLNRVSYVFSVAAANAGGAGPATESGPLILRAPPSAVLSSVLVDPAGTVTADGVSAALVTVIVRDAEGFALAGQGVNISAAGSGNTLVQVSEATDAEGIATATLTSTVAEEKALTVTVNGLLELTAVPTVTFVPGPPARLRILQRPPAAVVAGVTFAPAPRIRVEDAHGNAAAGAPTVTLSIASGPIGGALLGVLSAAASAGMATLDAVRIELAGTYQLQVAIEGLAPVSCGRVVVSAAPATHLTFDVAPGPIRTLEAFAPALKVGFRDAFGNLSSPGPLSVTLRLAPSEDAGVLGGTATRVQTSGVASFGPLYLDEPGTYALVASAPGFEDVTSAPFAVTAAWELVSPEGGDVKSVAVAADGSIVYALTSTSPPAGRVWRSLDGGVTWERASAGLRKDVSHVAADPTSATRAYVASLSDGLWVTENGGRRWRKVAASRSDEVAVGPDGTVLVKDGAKLRRSTDHGATWSADVSLPSNISAFEFDPSVGTTVYVGTWSSGVYRSSDGGASWSAAGGLASAGYVWQLAVDAGSPGTVWAATNHGLYESVDGGSTWTLNGSPSFQWTAVVLDPSVPNRMWAVRSGSVERSDDGGGRWVWAGLSSMASLFPVPGTGMRSSAILADGVYQDAMFRLPDGGTWERSAAGLRGALPRIAVHPADPAIVLAGHRGVERTTDGGLTWSAATGVPVGSEPASMAFDPFASSSVLAAGSRLFKSNDTGVSWVNTGTISGPLLFDRANRGTVLAAHSSSVYRSVDGGASWAPSNTGFPSTSVRLFVQDPVDPLIILAATWSDGLYRSVDGGATWVAMSSPSTTVTALSIDPRDGRVLVALGANGVSLTNDGGATWQQVVTWASIASGTLARDPGNPDVLLAGASSDLYRSDDGGMTWSRACSGYLGGSVAYQILFASPGVAYVSSGTGVYRTTTGGR